jgi:hypothetical protein
MYYGAPLLWICMVTQSGKCEVLIRLIEADTGPGFVLKWYPPSDAVVFGECREFYTNSLTGVAQQLATIFFPTQQELY